MPPSLRTPFKILPPLKGDSLHIFRIFNPLTCSLIEIYTLVRSYHPLSLFQSPFTTSSIARDINGQRYKYSHCLHFSSDKTSFFSANSLSHSSFEIFIWFLPLSHSIQVFRKQFRLSLWNLLPPRLCQNVCVLPVVEHAIVINESLRDYLIALVGAEAEGLKDPHMSLCRCSGITCGSGIPSIFTRQAAWVILFSFIQTPFKAPYQCWV